MTGIEHIINNSNLKNVQANKSADPTAFVKAFKQADELIQVNQSAKKEKEEDEDEHKSGQHSSQQNPETEKDEVEEILEEIEARLDKLLKMAEDL